jgi:hypothetical protein
MSKRWTKEEETALIKDIYGGYRCKDLITKYGRTELALDMRLKKIIYENIVGGRQPPQLAKALRMPEDMINQYYYSYKEHLTKQDKPPTNVLEHPKSADPVQDAIDRIDGSLEMATVPPIKIQNGGAKMDRIENLEKENRMLKAIIENKDLRDRINKLAKKGELDSKTKKMIKLLKRLI